jgi:hypothetical protein
MERQPIRFKVLAAVVGLGQAAAICLGGFGLREGLNYLRGETCPMGALGGAMFSMMVLLYFDLPLLVGTLLVVWLARRQLSLWVRVGLVAGLVVAIVVPLAGLACSMCK